MYTLRITTRDSKLIVRKKTAKIKVGASVKRGLKGEAGEDGSQGIQGDPGTTDYNELQNKPDLTLKADKTYVDTQDTALQAAINTKQPTGDYATNTALASGLAIKADTSSLAPVATSGDYTDLTNKPTIPTVPVQSVNTRTGAVTGLAEASDLTAHTGNTSNPHSVTKAQVGLGNVDNTSDVNKPISTATQTALDGKFTQRTITGTTNQITVTNGDGVSGNPTLSLPQDIHTGASPMFAGLTLNGTTYTTGSGFPNGVVSASVGSIYMDTAVTNGASSWIKKSGTGNTGWQVLEGDTGWRDILGYVNTSYLSTTNTSTNFLKIRRSGNIVKLFGRLNVTATSVGVQQLLLGTYATDFAGMRSISQYAPIVRITAADGWNAPSEAIMRAFFAVEPPEFARFTSGQNLSIDATWMTSEVWPATLPGTAV